MKIRNSSEASIIINAAIRSHAEVWRKAKDTEDYLINSATPFEEKDLKEQGLSWKNNWNFGRGRSQIEQGVLNNTTDVINSLTFLEVNFEPYNTKKHKDKIFSFLVDDYIKDILATAISGALIDTLEEDERIHPWISSIEYHSYCFGYCPVIRDPLNYLGNPVPITEVAFEDKTRIGQFTTWVVFDTTKAEVLYEKYIRNKDRNTIPIEHLGEVTNFYPDGWTQEGLLDTLCHKITDLKLKKDEQPIIPTTWEDVDKIFTEYGRTTIDQNINNIYIAKIYTVDGLDIVETYICISGITYDEVNANFVGARKHLLYQKIHRNTPYTKFLNIIKEYGLNVNMFIHELRGAGKFIAQDALRYDINRNGLQDKLMFSGSPWINTGNSLIGKQAKIKVTGAYVEVAEEVTMIPNQTRFDLNDHITALRIDEEQHNKNIFHYNPKLDLSRRPTKDKVSVKGNEVSTQKRAKSPIKLKDYARLFNLILKDITDKTFEDSLNKEKQDSFFEYIESYIAVYGFELSREEIKKIISVICKTELAPANSDPNAIREALEIASSSESRKRLQVMYLLALGFSRKEARAYVEVQEFGNEVDKAASEHTMFFTTSEVPVGRHQDGLTHCNMHFAKMDRVLKGVVGGEDPVKGFTFLTNALINTGEHIQLLSINPFYKKNVKRFQKLQDLFSSRAKQLGEVVNQLREQENQRAQENQQQQQTQQGIPPEVLKKLEIKEFEAIKKMERTNMLTDNMMAKRQQMHDLEQELRKKQADAGIEISKELATLRKELELLKSSAKLA